jgi:tetratricopeptide (TPR) repeat protein
VRADANAELGNYEAAFRELDQLISLGQRDDAYPQVLNMSAWWRAVAPESRYRNARLAIAQARQSCSLTSYNDPEFIDTLAAAYAESGDFDAAIRTEEKALSLIRSPEDRKVVQKHMTAFKQHRPWRERGNE